MANSTDEEPPYDPEEDVELLGMLKTFGIRPKVAKHLDGRLVGETLDRDNEIHRNTFVLTKAEDYMNDQWGQDYHTLRSFQEDFDGWPLECFNGIQEDVRKALRAALKYKGVFIKPRLAVAPQLFNLLKTEKLPPWDEEELMEAKLDENTRAWKQRQQAMTNKEAGKNKNKNKKGKGKDPDKDKQGEKDVAPEQEEEHDEDKDEEASDEEEEDEGAEKPAIPTIPNPTSRTRPPEPTRPLWANVARTTRINSTAGTSNTARIKIPTMPYLLWQLQTCLWTPEQPPSSPNCGRIPTTIRERPTTSSTTRSGTSMIRASRPSGTITVPCRVLHGIDRPGKGLLPSQQPP